MVLKQMAIAEPPCVSTTQGMAPISGRRKKCERSTPSISSATFQPALSSFAFRAIENVQSCVSLISPTMVMPTTYEQRNSAIQSALDIALTARMDRNLLFITLTSRAVSLSYCASPLSLSASGR